MQDCRVAICDDCAHGEHEQPLSGGQQCACPCHQDDVLDRALLREYCGESFQ